MAEPTWIRKLFLLGGIRAKAGEKAWVQQLLEDPNTARRGLMLALPNTVLVGLLGLLNLAVGDRLGLLFLGIAAAVFAGGLVPAITSYRSKYLARRNGLKFN